MKKLSSVMKACGVFLFWATTAIALPAQTFTTLYRFNGANGFLPSAGLVQGIDGKLYGTASSGSEGGGNGSVFKITTNGMLTTLHSFNDTDGRTPAAAMVLATNGDLYGTTEYGGTHGCGTVFEITPGGTLTTLHSFDCSEGSSPTAGLVQGTDGRFYGTTSRGGADNLGTVFSITLGGTLMTLHSFTGTDGEYPAAGLVQGSNGIFYGTTPLGGAANDGTIFTISAGGTLTTLHSFDGADGDDPFAGLLRSSDGNFYGTTSFGGPNVCTGFGCGTVFTITPGGTLTTLHNFAGTDGAAPAAGLNQGSDGNLYGTTSSGGANANSSCTNGCGTIFLIAPDNSLTTLYNFCSQGGDSCTDGDQPHAALVQGTDGNFYGTAEYGGACAGCGTVFSLSVGLGPFVETNPGAGKTGAPIRILGTDLAGASMVTFHGVPATFTVKSKSEITTTVPARATTGPVKVVTPDGTLSSNVAFRVLP